MKAIVGTFNSIETSQKADYLGNDVEMRDGVRVCACGGGRLVAVSPDRRLP